MDKEVKKYFDRQEPLQKDILEKIRQLIKKTVPGAEELMNYGVPAFRLGGKLILYAAFKKHVGLYPTPEMIKNFQAELKGYKTSKGTIQFSLDEPMPYDLIIKIVRSKFNICS